MKPICHSYSLINLLCCPLLSIRPFFSFYFQGLCWTSNGFHTISKSCTNSSRGAFIAISVFNIIVYEDYGQTGYQFYLFILSIYYTHLLLMTGLTAERMFVPQVRQFFSCAILFKRKRALELTHSTVGYIWKF